MLSDRAQRDRRPGRRDLGIARRPAGRPRSSTRSPTTSSRSSAAWTGRACSSAAGPRWADGHADPARARASPRSAAATSRASPTDLRSAFGATVVGLLVGTVAFALTLVRTRFYTEDLAALERASTTPSRRSGAGVNRALGRHGRIGDDARATRSTASSTCSTSGSSSRSPSSSRASAWASTPRPARSGRGRRRRRAQRRPPCPSPAGPDRLRPRRSDRDALPPGRRPAGRRRARRQDPTRHALSVARVAPFRRLSGAIPILAGPLPADGRTP